MSESRGGCIGALVIVVALCAFTVVVLGLFAGGWYWYANVRGAPVVTTSTGPWTLSVQNPNPVPISVSCALESAAPVEVAPGGAAEVQVTNLPVMCTGTTEAGLRALSFDTSVPPTDGHRWSVTAERVVAGEPAAEDKAPAQPDEDAEVRTTAPAATTLPKAAGAVKAVATAATTKKVEPAVPPPAPPKTAPVSFRYPGGPKFGDLEVSIDGVSAGTRPSGATVRVGSHTIQFTNGSINLSCPIDVGEGGRVVALPRKLDCPPASVD